MEQEQPVLLLVSELEEKAYPDHVAFKWMTDFLFKSFGSKRNMEYTTQTGSADNLRYKHMTL